MRQLLFTFAFLLLPSFLFAAQSQPAGEQSLTSVVGSKWGGIRFRVDFDEAAIKADPELLITITVSTCASGCSDDKNFRTISTGIIKGGSSYSEKGDTVINFPVEGGHTARLTVAHNKDLVFNMSMGAK